jgi:phosphotransferase system enzyme I (PtsI)
MIIFTMRIMKGIAASSGIGLGAAFLYTHEKLTISRTLIKESKIEGEKVRFQHALKIVKRELEAIIESPTAQNHKEIVDAYLLMVSDPDFIDSVENKIEVELMGVEWAVESVIATLISALEQSEDLTFRERSIDFYDIGNRIIRVLLGKKRADLTTIDEEVVVVADNLLPSEALLLDPKNVKAIALSGGGRTSHVAILARAFQIPTVVGLGNLTEKVRNGDQVIVDGNLGEVIIRPSSSSAEKLRLRHQRWIEHKQELLKLANEESVTKDGHKVKLKVNIETPEEIDTVVSYKDISVGLFRSEFLFLKPGGASEDEQFEAYKTVLEKLNGIGSVTIRTIDVGGDKIIPGMAGLGEENPILGWRAVRFCLSKKDIFRTQLKALLRASVYGKLKIMFPMISGTEELESVLLIVEQVKDQLRSLSIEFDEDIEIGIMVEVPSAALSADLLVDQSDFFSIGTNDLIQYTIAVDRGNEKIAYLYQPFHPGVLRLIKMIIDKGHAGEIKVAMCGEMAGDPFSAVLLLGLGLDEFSMSPQSLLEIKNIIRSVTLEEAQLLAQEVMKMSSYVNINTYIKDWMHAKFPDLFSI